MAFVANCWAVIVCCVVPLVPVTPVNDAGVIDGVTPVPVPLTVQVPVTCTPDTALPAVSRAVSVIVRVTGA